MILDATVLQYHIRRLDNRFRVVAEIRGDGANTYVSIESNDGGTWSYVKNTVRALGSRASESTILDAVRSLYDGFVPEARS